MPATLNALLAKTHPAARACLSPLGEAARFPQDIIAQSHESRGAELRATIGQFTHGDGQAYVPAALSARLSEVDPEMAFLYSPPGGHEPLRRTWKARIDRGTGPTSLPLVTHGLTHGLSICADLFADPDTTVVLPTPHWGNYRLIFELRRGARLLTYPFFDAAGRFNVQGLRDCLGSVPGKAIVILNFPGNPTGYSPQVEDVPAIVDAVVSHPGPLVAITDDAYYGMIFEPGVQVESLFWSLLAKADPRRTLAVKVDGCTKELMFFGGRTGFLTFGVGGEAAAVLEEKGRTIVRATVNVPNGPAQAIALAALEDPALPAQMDHIRGVLERRYRALKDSLAELRAPLRPYPFNGGFFALIAVDRAVDASALRLHLLHKHSAGVIVIPSQNAIRIAFCSIEAERIPELMRRVQLAAEELLIAAKR